MDVLLVRAGALGDVLLLRRAVAALRGAGHRLRLVAPSRAGAALVGPGPSEVDACFPWDGAEAAALLGGAPAAGALAEALSSADLVIAWTRSSDVVRALARGARRVVPQDPAPPDGGEHASLWLARPVADLGLDVSVEPPPLAFTEAEHAEADRRLDGLAPGFLALHPGSGSAAKNWPWARFFELAARVADGRFLLCLGPAELERGLGASAPAAALVALEWPVRVLGAALSRAGLYVGNDSGASHLAAAVGAPTLALFGPTDPGLWSPVGPRVRCLRTADGLAALRVDDVLEAARALRAERP